MSMRGDLTLEKATQAGQLLSELQVGKWKARSAALQLDGTCAHFLVLYALGQDAGPKSGGCC